MLSTLIRLLVGLILLGVASYLVERFLPMPAGFRLAIRVVIVLIVLLYVYAVLAGLPGPI